MKNDEYIQTYFEMIATIRRAVGVGITMMMKQRDRGCNRF